MRTDSRAIWAVLGLVAFGTGAISNERERAIVAPGVPVHFTEGSIHGFLELTTEAGKFLARGDLLQVARNGGVESRMVFHFGNGSVFEESVTFTEHDVFTMETYHLIQSGPAFANDLDASLSRTGSYVVRTKSHKDGTENEYAGSIAMPGDVYNGMVITVAKNSPADRTTLVHAVAFLPRPRLVALELTPSGAQRVQLGQHEESGVSFTVKPKLGFFLHLGAKLAGQLQPDTHITIVTDDVPAFVRSDGPLYTGPIWRISLVAPSPLARPLVQ